MNQHHNHDQPGEHLARATSSHPESELEFIMTTEPHNPTPPAREAAPPNEGVIDLGQYTEVMSNLTDALDQFEINSAHWGLEWVMKCVNECYQADARKPDQERSLDVVTCLAYLMMQLIIQNGDQGERVESLVEFMRTESLPELRSTPTIIPPKIDIVGLLAFCDELDKIEALVLSEFEHGPTADGIEGPTCTG